MLFDLIQTVVDVRAVDPHFQRLIIRAEYRDRWLAQLVELELTDVIAGEYRSFTELAALRMLAEKHGVPLPMSDLERIARELEHMPAQPEISSPQNVRTTS